MTYRRYWAPEVVVLVLIAVVGTLPFWLTSLDLDIARYFYSHQNDINSWPLGDFFIWRFLFWLAPWLTILIGLVALLILTIGIIQRNNVRLRIYGLFLLLCVVTGPGLVVNAIFKDHWERPRPREVQEFGGIEPYTPPLRIGTEGNSFPCGHCSVGFVCGAFYLIWRRRYPVRAFIALSASLGLGSLRGVARMAAGGHFLSDIVWAAILTWSVVLLLYWPLMRIPWREDNPELYPLSNGSVVVMMLKLGAIAIIAIGGVIVTWRLY